MILVYRTIIGLYEFGGGFSVRSSFVCSVFRFYCTFYLLNFMVFNMHFIAVFSDLVVRHVYEISVTQGSFLKEVL